MNGKITHFWCSSKYKRLQANPAFISSNSLMQPKGWMKLYKYQFISTLKRKQNISTVFLNLFGEFSCPGDNGLISAHWWDAARPRLVIAHQSLPHWDNDTFLQLSLPWPSFHLSCLFTEFQVGRVPTYSYYYYLNEEIEIRLDKSVVKITWSVHTARTEAWLS